MKIKVIDGIPCMIVDDGIFWSKEIIEQKSKKLIMPERFTEFQQNKETNYYKKVLDELKKKFREK